MSKLPKPRPLTDHEIELVRMVSRGLSNAQIAVEFDIRPETVRSRLHAVYKLTGTSSTESDPLARVRLVIWAYDQGLVRPADVKPVPTPKPARPVDMVPAELAAPMIRLSLDILGDQPRGDLRRWARLVVEAAGVRVPEAARRGRPVAVPADTDEQAA